MARVTILFYLNGDNEKDKELLEWLNKNSNRSAFIKNKLYDSMLQEGGEFITRKRVEKEEVSVSKGFMDSMLAIGG